MSSLSDFAIDLRIPREAPSEVDDWPGTIRIPLNKRPGFFMSSNYSPLEEACKNLRRYTDSGSQNFSEKHRGSTGWEYSFWALLHEGKLLCSDIDTNRNYEKVTSSFPSIELKRDFDGAIPQLVERVLLDGKEKSEATYKGESELEDYAARVRAGEYPVKLAMHVHSHPRVQIAPGKTIFTMFSEIDLKSLLGGKALMLGLVTDMLWVAAKTKGSRSPSNEDLAELTSAELKPQTFAEEAGRILRRSQIALYRAEFSDALLTRV